MRINAIIFAGRTTIWFCSTFRFHFLFYFSSIRRLFFSYATFFCVLLFIAFFLSFLGIFFKRISWCARKKSFTFSKTIFLGRQNDYYKYILCFGSAFTRYFFVFFSSFSLSFYLCVYNLWRWHSIQTYRFITVYMLRDVHSTTKHWRKRHKKNTFSFCVPELRANKIKMNGPCTQSTICNRRQTNKTNCFWWNRAAAPRIRVTVHFYDFFRKKNSFFVFVMFDL